MFGNNFSQAIIKLAICAREVNYSFVVGNIENVGYPSCMEPHNLPRQLHRKQLLGSIEMRVIQCYRVIGIKICVPSLLGL